MSSSGEHSNQTGKSKDPNKHKKPASSLTVEQASPDKRNAIIEMDNSLGEENCSDEENCLDEGDQPFTNQNPRASEDTRGGPPITPTKLMGMDLGGDADESYPAGLLKNVGLSPWTVLQGKSRQQATAFEAEEEDRSKGEEGGEDEYEEVGDYEYEEGGEYEYEEGGEGDDEEVGEDEDEERGKK